MLNRNEYKNSSHNWYLTGDKAVTWKVAIAVVSDVAVHLLVQRPEGADVGVGHRVKHIYLKVQKMVSIKNRKKEKAFQGNKILYLQDNDKIQRLVYALPEMILIYLCYDYGACEDYDADHRDHESNVILSSDILHMNVITNLTNLCSLFFSASLSSSISFKLFSGVDSSTASWDLKLNNQIAIPIHLFILNDHFRGRGRQLWHGKGCHDVKMRSVSQNTV